MYITDAYILIISVAFLNYTSSYLNPPHESCIAVHFYNFNIQAARTENMYNLDSYIEDARWNLENCRRVGRELSLHFRYLGQKKEKHRLAQFLCIKMLWTPVQVKPAKGSLVL